MSASPAAASPSFRLAALLTTLVALGPLSTDLYLPSLPTLARVFATDAARIQLTLSVFLAGFAVAQLAYGALSDRFGRRPLMLGGLLLYFVASLACLFADSVETLIAARFVQALGACAGPVLGRAIVRDVWGPVEAVRVLAYVSGAMALAPLLGPTLGGYLTVWFGWQANFALLVLFSLLQIGAVWFWLAESNGHRDPTATRPGRILANFRILLADRNYLGYLLALSFSYSTLFAFISGSSFVLIARFGLSPQLFGLSFGLVVAGYLAGSMLSGKLVRRFGGDRLLLAGAWLGALAGATMWGLEAAGPRHVAALLGPMFFVTLAVGLVMSNAVGQALAPYPKMAGAASSLMGFCQMGIGALVGMLVGHGVDGAATVLPMTVAGCALLVPLCHLALVRHPAP
ncbi:multidrug effflux MFS transporter [Dechloromonas denitrificans]|uniref:multidrug effflux MFS transporter n=1 Tax=Dechloromonas denitrificans TaxID=281362 RepID=UPI001CFB804E|nr:multidrug effflux MFS transporter [Dechloromonas denitrificans]